MTIIDIVCRHYNITRDEICKRTREWRITEPRSVCMWMYYYYSSLKIEEIAAIFKMSHSSVSIAVGDINKHVAKSWQLSDTVKSVENKAISVGYTIVYPHGRHSLGIIRNNYPTFKLRLLPAPIDLHDTTFMGKIKRRCALAKQLQSLEEELIHENNFTNMFRLNAQINDTKKQIRELLNLNTTS